jgi:hypothetical protein
MRYLFFCTSNISVRNLSKTGGYIVFVFTFIWIWPQKISKTTHWIFQICRDCDHETICIPKLNVLYQISLSEDFKNIFVFIIMSSNHEKMFVWNASIWFGRPCTNKSGLEVRFRSYRLLMRRKLDNYHCDILSKTWFPN